MTGIRDWIGLQKEMVQEIGSILSLTLLTINLSISVFLLIQQPTGFLSRPALVIPLFIVVTGLSVWLFARAWHFVGMMHKSKQRALATLNPYMTTDFHPHEWALWYYVNLPQLKAQRDMMVRLDMDPAEIDACIDRVEKWLREGRIPKDEFPDGFRPLLRAV
ncbi:MAG TPA: hypothetical protein VM681_11315 [Candidatus Thermoplasmatota archaeon]|nr:hypothetical protein [Candidatus Thermoplasmatota archaeon]